MPTPIQATTQEHLDIEDIVENIILLKDGSAAMVLTTTAVNFGLLSESEQDATIYAYAALLNSLTFPIQILIRSHRKDISGYEKLLAEQEVRAIQPQNKERIRKYREFIQETVRERNVLDKKFYITIPFSVMELGVTKSATALVKGRRRGLPFPKDYIIKRAKMALDPKSDHLVHQLARLGLKARQLTTKELIQLMFEIYNPDSAQGQILASPKEYETPLVKAAVAFQENPQITGPEEGPPTTPPPPVDPPPAATPSTAQPQLQPKPNETQTTESTDQEAQAAINAAVGAQAPEAQPSPPEAQPSPPEAQPSPPEAQPKSEKR